jgi:hypothetical protein
MKGFLEEFDPCQIASAYMMYLGYDPVVGPVAELKEPLMFKTNVGGIDRILRIVVGLVLLAMFFVYPEASWRYFMLIGVVPLFTGLFGTCPLYSVLGLSTCPAKNA